MHSDPWHLIQLLAPLRLPVSCCMVIVRYILQMATYGMYIMLFTPLRCARVCEQEAGVAGNRNSRRRGKGMYMTVVWMGVHCMFVMNSPLNVRWFIIDKCTTSWDRIVAQLTCTSHMNREWCALLDVCVRYGDHIEMSIMACTFIAGPRLSGVNGG